MLMFVTITCFSDEHKHMLEVIGLKLNFIQLHRISAIVLQECHVCSGHIVNILLLIFQMEMTGEWEKWTMPRLP